MLSHFTEKETEAPGGQVIFPRSSNQKLVKMNLNMALFEIQKFFSLPHSNAFLLTTPKLMYNTYPIHFMMVPTQKQSPLNKGEVLTSTHGMIQLMFSGSLKYTRGDNSCNLLESSEYLRNGTKYLRLSEKREYFCLGGSTCHV